MSEKLENGGASTARREPRGKRRVVVELYRRDEGGALIANGKVVTEYVDGRRGGAVRELPGAR